MPGSLSWRPAPRAGGAEARFTGRAAVSLVALLLSGVLLGACMANPGPPPVVEPAATAPSSSGSSDASASQDESAAEAEGGSVDGQEPGEGRFAGDEEAQAQGRSQITVGIDPLTSGLNPHLVSDASEVVTQLADLVLPSVYRHGELDRDLMVSVEEVPATPGSAQTLHYRIAPQAQWSDGTPVTGNDFRYLWEGMRDTPGTIGAAPYLAIEDLRVSEGGKAVDVDLGRRLADHRVLFTHLLPSHLLHGQPFAESLATTIPASAGRLMVRAVDHSRGVVELGRNDRYWGSETARTELVYLRPVRGVVEGTDYLRSGQFSYLDITPEETSVEAFALVPEVRQELVATNRQLVLTMSTLSDGLKKASVRGAVASLIDVPTVARLAAGRSAPLAPSGFSATAAPEDVEALAGTHLTIAADPGDRAASAAVRAVADLLHRAGVEVTIAEVDPTSAAGLLPEGEIDALIGWDAVDPDAAELASRYGCGSSLSGYCTPETQEVLDRALAGEPVPEGFVDALEQLEHLRVPILAERRLRAQGAALRTGFEAIPGLATAARWEVESPESP